jgi:branched-chain amino acid transport system ATP-binding protein
MSLLEAVGISKRFEGIRALSDVSLRVEAGQLQGLIGPNGAGKTTLFNCLYGVDRPGSGRVLFDGRDITRAPVYERARLGIGRTFQRIELFGGMTVLDHLLVAGRARRQRGGVLRDLVGRSGPTASERDQATSILELLGLTNVAGRPIEALGLGRGRLVELGRALMTDPRLLFLDEPSSGLDSHETAEMAATLEEVNAEREVAVVLVEHDLALVRRIARQLSCLNLGTLIAEGPTTDVLADPAVRRAYLGDAA